MLTSARPAPMPSAPGATVLPEVSICDAPTAPAGSFGPAPGATLVLPCGTIRRVVGAGPQWVTIVEYPPPIGKCARRFGALPPPRWADAPALVRP